MREALEKKSKESIAVMKNIDKIKTRVLAFFYIKMPNENSHEE